MRFRLFVGFFVVGFPLLAAASPEEVAVSYWKHRIAGQDMAAYELLSRSDRRALTSEEWSARLAPRPLLPSKWVVKEQAVERDGDTASVRLTISFPEIESVLRASLLLQRSDDGSQSGLRDWFTNYVNNELPVTSRSEEVHLVKEEEVWRVFEGLEADKLRSRLRDSSELPLIEREKLLRQIVEADPAGHEARTELERIQERLAYLDKLVLEDVRTGEGERFGRRETGVFGELHNTGTRTLTKVAVTTYFLDDKGRAMFEAQYHPVLVTGSGDTDELLKPNYRESFGYSASDVPSGWSGDIIMKVTDLEFAAFDATMIKKASPDPSESGKSTPESGKTDTANTPGSSDKTVGSDIDETVDSDGSSGLAPPSDAGEQKSSGTGEWSVETSVNPIDDSKTVIVALRANSGESRWDEPIMLVVRCKSNETDLYIRWGDYLGSDSPRVLTRIGDNDATTIDWNNSTDNQATFYPNNAIRYLKRIMAADRFVAQVTPYNEAPVTAIFDTTGMRESIRPLADTCNWELPETDRHTKTGTMGAEKTSEESRADDVDSALIREIQKLLKHSGYTPGPVDGILGEGTQTAIRQYQKDNGMEIDGDVDNSLLTSLRSHEKASVDPQVAKYMTLIRGKIVRNWNMPAFLKGGDADDTMKASISVRLTSEGEVESARIEESSGDLAFDRSVENAVLKASPLPVPREKKLNSEFRDLTLTLHGQ